MRFRWNTSETIVATKIPETTVNHKRTIAHHVQKTHYKICCAIWTFLVTNDQTLKLTDWQVCRVNINFQSSSVIKLIFKHKSSSTSTIKLVNESHLVLKTQQKTEHYNVAAKRTARLVACIQEARFSDKSLADQTASCPRYLSAWASSLIWLLQPVEPCWTYHHTHTTWSFETQYKVKIMTVTALQCKLWHYFNF